MRMTRARKRKAARDAWCAAEWRKNHSHLIGTRHRNCGNLTLGEEWVTSYGFRVRQVEVSSDRFEDGHFHGWIEVIGFAA